MLGGAVAAGLFAFLHKKPFLLLADAMVIPAAFLMGIGRLGNFIDGQIVGAVTDVWWAVQFPDADGFRHPVVLYDGAKNLLLMTYLLHVRRVNTTPGAVAARFVFWYAFPRFFIDLFREYPTHRLALGTGQTLNIVMALLGAALLYRSRLRRLGRPEASGRYIVVRLVAGRGATTCPARRLRVPAGVLPDHAEQLDAGHPVQVRGTALGAEALLALSDDRHRPAAIAHGQRGAQSVSRAPLGLRPGEGTRVRWADSFRYSSCSLRCRRSRRRSHPRATRSPSLAAAHHSPSRSSRPAARRHTGSWARVSGTARSSGCRSTRSGSMLIRMARERRSHRSRGSRHRRSSPTETFYRRLLDLDFAMTLRLVMIRTVDGGDAAEAFDDALRPRMAQAMRGATGSAAEAALESFGRYFDVDKVQTGTEIVFSCNPEGRLTTSVEGGERPRIDSAALCRALFDVYLGEAPISDTGETKGDRRIPGPSRALHNPINTKKNRSRSRPHAATRCRVCSVSAHRRAR